MSHGGCRGFHPSDRSASSSMFLHFGKDEAAERANAVGGVVQNYGKCRPQLFTVRVVWPVLGGKFGQQHREEGADRQKQLSNVRSPLAKTGSISVVPIARGLRRRLSFNDATVSVADFRRRPPACTRSSQSCTCSRLMGPIARPWLAASRGRRSRQQHR